MFVTKQKNLIEPKVQTKTTKNAFLNAALVSQSETLSGNGALKYSTSGDDFVDQFSNVGSYKPTVNKSEKSFRSFDTISGDCERLWGQSKLKTVMFILWIRMITRVTMLLNGNKTEAPQKGAEMRYEGIMRMIWLHMKDPAVFWKNIGLFISVGSWKDIFTMLSIDLQYNGWKDRKLDWKRFGELILSGIENPNTTNLVKKYLPQIKSSSNAKTLEAQADTLVAKWVASLCFGNKTDNKETYKLYRLMKTSGSAHDWQKLISQKQFNRIDFSKIHGRALSKLVKSKFLENQGLKDKYTQWVTKPEMTTVKFTGFVHELFEKMPNNPLLVQPHVAETINKQFNELVQKAMDNKPMETNFIVVRDTSGSMGAKAIGTNMSSNAIAKSLAIYFSEFLKGTFSNAWIEFADGAKLHNWVGNTPVEKFCNDKSEAYGGTNFQSVIDLFCSMKHKGVPESEFPTGILCISDGEFNPAQLGKTNVDMALDKLKKSGFSNSFVKNFVIVLWNIPNWYYSGSTPNFKPKFETINGVPNVYYFGGYSGAIISFLTEGVKNTNELFDSAMNQEILNMVSL